MSQRITLETIARQSGVSLATVSLVLRDKPGINDETRQRVMEVARSLGYRRRIQPDVVTNHGLELVGMLHKIRADDHPQTNAFYGPVVTGIEAACRRQHINLLYATVPVDADSHPLELPRLLMEDKIDGILLVGAFVDVTIARLMERRTISTVLVDGYAAENVYDSVVSDNFNGAHEAVSYLIKRGHRHIGMVGGWPQSYPSIEERRRGYLQALHDHGIHDHHFGNCNVQKKDVMAAATELLQRFPYITALFCCNDMTAFATMQAAQSLGRRIPDDLSVIGFDNVDMAEHVTPGLTTMHIDKVAMGRLAVQLLTNRAEFPDSSYVSAVLRPKLVERQSVRSL